MVQGFLRWTISLRPGSRIAVLLVALCFMGACADRSARTDGNEIGFAEKSAARGLPGELGEPEATSEKTRVQGGAVDGETPIARGVVVERVPPSLRKAGLLEGDVLHSWRRLPAPPANPDEERGEIASVFDLAWLYVEQVPRGTLMLIGERAGKPTVFFGRMNRWGFETRPGSMPVAALRAYLKGKELVEAEDIAGGIALWEEAAEAARRSNDGLSRCWLLTRIADVWAKRREEEKACAVYRVALEEARELVAQVRVLDLIGMHCRRDLSQAEASYRSALRIRQATWGESLSLAKSQYDIAGLVRPLGKLNIAEKLLKDALLIQERLAPESLVVAATLNVLGRLALDQGDLEMAGDYLRRALEIQELLTPDSLDHAASLNSAGMLARSRGDRTLAEEYHQRALEIRKKLAPRSFPVAASLNNLGEIAFESGDVDMAREHFERAQEIWAELVPESLALAAVLDNLGTVARDRGEPELSQQYLQRALEINEKLAPGSLLLAINLESLGLLASVRGELEAAENYHRRALEIREKLAPGSLAEANSLYQLGVVARVRGEPELEVQFFDRAVKALETQANRFGGVRTLQANLMAAHSHYYRHWIDTLLGLNRREEAFHVLERSRAQSFLAMLAERHLLFQADLPEEMARRRQRLGVELDRTYHQLMKSGSQTNPEEIEALRSRIEDYHRQLGEIREQIRRTSPRLATLQYPQPLDLEGVWRALDHGTVMLAYNVGDERTNLFVIDREGGLTVESLDVGEHELRKRVALLRNLISRARPGSELGSFRIEHFQQLSRRLYETLIEPAAARLEKAERILILPDSSLHTLPWNVLIRETPTESGNPERRRQYLLEWKPVHIALSATVYAELKQSRPRQPESGTPILQAAFGDPLYPEKFAHSDPDTIADVRVRSAAERGFDFRPLPATRLEVEDITRLFGGGRAYVGAEATEEQAKTVGRGVRYLHFAVHGHLDERFPLSSALALTIPEAFREDRDNGLLQVWEIFEQVRLDADLVVLSACESALGQELGGEGLIGLTRAFQYAGARSVVASLWQVSDASTAALMIRFYRHLRAGKPKDEALRAAQLELVRGPLEVPSQGGKKAKMDASAPYYWAPFQLYGDWR